MEDQSQRFRINGSMMGSFIGKPVQLIGKLISVSAASGASRCITRAEARDADFTLN